MLIPVGVHNAAAAQRVEAPPPLGHYKRAWEIVNATDSEYLKYVAELSR